VKQAKQLIIPILFALSTSALATPTLELPKDTITFRADFNDESVGDFVRNAMLVQGDTLHVYIDSPGGSVPSLDRMVTAADTFRAQGKKIHCYADYAASAAFMMFQLVCDKRFVFGHSILMQHQGSFGVKGQVNRIDSIYSFVKRLMTRLDKATAKRIGMTLEAYSTRIVDDWYLGGDEAVSSKVADAKILLTCSKEALNTHKTYNMQVFIFKIKVTESNCPLIPPKWELGMGEDLGTEIPAVSARERFVQYQEHYRNGGN
jgi:ATP-dependent protease ClpP protease subunit